VRLGGGAVSEPGRGGGWFGDPETLYIWLLGGFRVRVGSRVIEEDGWPLRKAAGLIKLLALAPGHRLHRERIMDLLWPDLSRWTQASNSRPRASPVDLYPDSAKNT
jgi:hypothetical protein